MKTIPLRQGLEAIVDDEDYPVVSKITWSWSKVRHNIYVYHSISRKRYHIKKNVYLHRLIMKAPPGSG